MDMNITAEEINRVLSTYPDIGYGIVTAIVVLLIIAVGVELRRRKIKKLKLLSSVESTKPVTQTETSSPSEIIKDTRAFLGGIKQPEVQPKKFSELSSSEKTLIKTLVDKYSEDISLIQESLRKLKEKLD